MDSTNGTISSRKIGTAIILKSKQGAGKGTLIDIFRKMMGAYVGETSNPQQDIFGNHENIHISEILTSLDEVCTASSRDSNSSFSTCTPVVQASGQTIKTIDFRYTFRTKSEKTL